MKPYILLILLFGCAKSTPPTAERGLKIGDSTAGGTIFYLDATGSHGLVAAPYDQSSSTVWYNGNGVYVTTNAVSPSDGMKNTNTIVSVVGPGDFAAYLCQSSTINNMPGWYLPSKNELDLMYKNKSVLKGLQLNNGYWSSTESDSVLAWVEFFNNGYQTPDNKFAKYPARSIRAF